MDLFEKVIAGSSPFITFNEESKKLKDDFSKGITKALDLHFKEGLSEVPLSILNRIDIQDSPSSQATFFYYLSKGVLELIDYKPSLADYSFKNAKEYFSNTDPVYIKNLYTVQTQLHFHDKEKSPIHKIFKKLDITKNSEYWLWRRIAYIMAGEGMLVLNGDIPGIRIRKKEKPDFFHNLYFSNYVLKGDVAKAKEYLTMVDKVKYNLAFACDFRMMNILDDNFDKRSWDQFKISDQSTKKYYDYLVALRQNQPQLALEIAKEMVVLADSGLHFPNESLADAEICNKNIKAATYLISKAVFNYRSDFELMQARIEYQKNNLKKCAQYFLSAQVDYDKKGKSKMFEFKIKCAVELSGFDLFKIMNEVNNLRKKSGKLNVNHLDTLPEKELLGVNCYIGSSKNSERVRDEIKQYSNLKVPILISGETGVGKEVVAQAIHEESQYSKEPFLPINCGAIVGSLLQSELFGHKAGAFTSAQKDHVGIFEAAGKGTVFLDEFGEMSPDIQIALLRVLETNQIRSIGSSKAKNIECRIIAATNANLPMLIKEHKFRSDLYYRLKSFEIKLSPLRKRKKEIIELVLYFLNEGRAMNDKCQLEKSAKDLLMTYAWPGNTRELKNEIHKIRVLHSNKLEYTQADFSFTKVDNHSSDKRLTSTDQLIDTPQDEDDLTIAVNYNAKDKRILKVKALFEKYKTIKRIQLISTLEISQTTATKDLKQLIEEGFIVKVTPTSSSRTHYFELIS